MHAIRLLLAAPVLLVTSPAALAGASAWHHVEGGAVRVVTGEAGPGGELRGALELRLEPGWKTYWMDPGDAGVPPMLTIRHKGADLPAELRFPAPQRFKDRYAAWAGYGRDVSFAFTLELPAGAAAAAALDAELFLGLCEHVCIPVQASLPVDLTAPQGQAETEAAFAALPGEPTGQFNATLTEAAGDMLKVDVTADGSADAIQLFVATDGRAMLGMPREAGRHGAALRFLVPVLSGADTIDAGSRLPYTIISDGDAVSGVLHLPPAN